MITKKQKQAFIKNQLATNKAWALRALEIVYNNQTDTEKAIETTHEDNGIGFTGTDGNFLSSLARQYQVRKSLSEKQMGFVFKKMPKYWNQILKVSDEEKLIICMVNENVVSQDEFDKWKEKQFVESI